MNCCKKKTILLFAAQHALYWCGVATFFSFLQAFLLARGYSLGDVGIATMLQTLSGMVGLFAWSMISDWLRTNKRTCIAICLVYMIDSVFLFTARSRAAVYLTSAIMGFSRTPLMSVLDTWSIHRLSACGVSYAPVRAVGSLAYAVVSSLFGFVINRLGQLSMLIASEVFLGMFLALCFFLEDIRLPEQGGDAPGRFDIRKAGGLLRNRQLLVLLLLLLLTGTAINARVVFFPVLIESAGGGLGEQGLCLGIAALSEIPGMLLLSRFRERSHWRIVFFSSLLYLSAFAMLIPRISIPLVFVSHIVTGFGYGLMMPTRKAMIFHLAAPELQTTAQATADVMYNCVAGILGSFAGGFLVPAAGMRASIGIITALLALIIPIMIFGLRRRG